MRQNASRDKTITNNARIDELGCGLAIEAINRSCHCSAIGSIQIACVFGVSTANIVFFVYTRDGIVVVAFKERYDIPMSGTMKSEVFFVLDVG